MPYKNEEEKKLNRIKYYNENKRKILDKTLIWQKINKEKVNLKNKIWKKNNKDKVHGTYIRYKDKYMQLVYNHYGNKCSFCGSDVRLTIDHMNNNGNEFRKKYKGAIWTWIVKNNFPDDLQVLCQKCNERKKRANKEGISLDEWVNKFNNKIKDIITLKKQGLSYKKISKELNISIYNVINLYSRYGRNNNER